MLVKLSCGCKVSVDGTKDVLNSECSTTSGGCQYGLFLSLVNKMYDGWESGKPTRPPIKTVYVVSGKSESGDEYGPKVFCKNPSKKTLKSLAKSWDYGDGDGPGDYGTYVYLSVSECPIE